MKLGRLKLITTRQAAKRIGCKYSTMRWVMRLEQFPTVRIDGRVYTNMPTLKEWVQAHPASRLRKYFTPKPPNRNHDTPVFTTCEDDATAIPVRSD